MTISYSDVRRPSPDEYLALTQSVGWNLTSHLTSDVIRQRIDGQQKKNLG